jgi:rhodanese-related sulfurtransferase
MRAAKLMRVAVILTIVILLLAGAAFFVFGRGREIQGGDARKLVAAGARLLDVRSPEEYAGGHLPGAVNIPVQQLDHRLAEVGPRDGELIVYCRSGHRSARATEILRQNGFTKVHNLGPMTAW